MNAARILVVDDERPNIEILARTLAAKGHATIAAESAEEALAALASTTCDLVLLDQVLPGATGMQSLGKLAALTRAPIYMMSGNSDDETQLDAKLLGAKGFFAKPLDINEILAVIAALPER